MHGDPSGRPREQACVAGEEICKHGGLRVGKSLAVSKNERGVAAGGESPRIWRWFSEVARSQRAS